MRIVCAPLCVRHALNVRACTIVHVAPKTSLVHNVHMCVDRAHIVHVVLVLSVTVLNAMLDVGIDTETSQHIHDDDFEASIG